MKEWRVNSSDGVHSLRVLSWIPEGQIKAVVQISHGMIEHMERYDEFAEFLCKEGYLVVGNDHLGHGGSVAREEELGYFAKEGKSEVLVRDLHLITRRMKEEYPGVPYILLGHSMGSFLARRYCMTYGEELDGVIILGTGTQPVPVLAFGKFVAGITKLLRGDEYRSNFIKYSAFGSYLSHIKNPKTASDWLSRDEERVKQYRADKLCRFDFTVNGYAVLFDVISFIQKGKNIQKIPKNLPILILSGEEDPVGAYGKGPRKVYQSYRKAGLKVQLKMYPEDRHELLHELDRKEVFQEILAFLSKLPDTDLHG